MFFTTSHFEVGKKYTTKYKTAPRTCLVVAKDYVLFSAQDDIPHSRPLTVDPHFWNEWEEYKFPVVLKYYIPVVRWSKTGNISFAYSSISAINRETVERSVAQYKDYELIDIVEVTWTEGEATKLQEHGKVR